MKTLVLLLALSLVPGTILVAQAPQAFKYQAIARDEAGNILSNWEIGLRISIVQGGQNGQKVFIETHRVISNIYGLINIVIGEGTAETGDFETINWGNNSHYIKLEMDTRGANDYKEIGVSQLYAVPYALYAERAGNIMEPKEQQSNETSKPSEIKSTTSRGSRNGTPNTKFPSEGNSHMNVNSGKVGVGTTDPQEKLDVVGKVMSSEGFNTNGTDGLTKINNIVSEIDFNNNLLKYITMIHSGGILIYLSDTSNWIDTVGVYILPVFTCGDFLVDTRDNRLYKTVLIGTQCWMGENLNLGNRINGEDNPIEDSNIEKYCYDDLESNCDTYGGLYQWDEAMGWVTTEGAQGICMDGWHLPTNAEWNVLVNYLGGTGVAGGKMKSTGTIEAGTGLWHTPNTDATNESGFTGLAGGSRSSSGDPFNSFGNYGNFWSSTEGSPPDVKGRRLHYNNDDVYAPNVWGSNGYSIRCLKY